MNKTIKVILMALLIPIALLISGSIAFIFNTLWGVDFNNTFIAFGYILIIGFCVIVLLRIDLNEL